VSYGRLAITLALAVLPLVAKKAKTPPKDSESSLEAYIQEINRRSHQVSNSSPGSLYSNTGRLADGFRDVRASQVFDLVTVVVSDRASAVSSGVTNTSRKSSANAAVTSLAGPIKATKPLANLLSSTGAQQLQGQGTTSRTSTLTTTVTTMVTDVLPNGNLVVQGHKEIMVNSERQIVTVRGIVRPDDLSPLNEVPSDRLAQLQVIVNGKGAVEDSIKRPFILYRLLLGLMPF
jgi:flagellar L-ring protein precursor FlgH